MSKQFNKPINPEKFNLIFLNEEYERIYHHTIKDFQKAVTFEQFREVASSFNQRNNNYKIEYCLKLQNLIHYVWLDEQKEKAIAVSFDEQDTIHSLYLKPFTTYRKSDARYTRTSYILPLKGEWFVFWGGTNEFINYHYVYETQRYAYDFIQVKDELSYKDTKLQNEDFYAFNQEILAPANGEVVKIIDGIKDNIPGEMNTAYPAGNYVVIKHRFREYSMLAHLRQNSIKVKEGDHVKEGQCVGYCGNSGNSSEPHLHFQIMNTPDFNEGKSIRIRFKGIEEPVQGDFVSNAKMSKEGMLPRIPQLIKKLFK